MSQRHRTITTTFKPRLIFEHTARKASWKEVEAALGHRVDRRRAFWLRDGKVYVYAFIGGVRWTLMSYDDEGSCWDCYGPALRKCWEESFRRRGARSARPFENGHP
jgi:hypothetical protein